MKRRVIFTIILLVTCLCSAFSLDFSYLINFAKDKYYDVYFTNNADEYSEKDKLTTYEMAPGDSANRGFYMHVLTNGDIASGKITVKFSQFEPEITKGVSSLSIPYDISFKNVRNYFVPVITPDKKDGVKWGVDNDDIAYTVSFGMNETGTTTSLQQHYIYRIEYDFGDLDFSNFPAQSYISYITVEVKPD